jgi:hypothetical protein
MRHLFAPLALLTLLAPGLSLATPVWTDAAKAQALIDAVVADKGASQDAVGRLAGLLHLEPPVRAPQIAPAPDFADASAPLNNQIRVLRAQGDRRDALIVQSGFTTLRNLAKAAEDQGIDGLRMVDGTAHLTRPLVVWLGAGLMLEPGDDLQMDGDSGAFLLGFGQIEMLNAFVHTARPPTTPDAYRPFVLITGQGTIFAEETRFTGLGMVGADPFGGVMVSQRGLFTPEFAPTLASNIFEDIGAVGLIGVTSGVISGNLVKAGRGGGITLAGVDGAQVTDNVIIGTKGGAGIKIANGTNVALSGNLIKGGASNGISVGGNSKDVRITGNAVLKNAETGIATQRATCVLVAGNSVAGNGASGLRLNASGVSRVQGNALVANTNAGLHVGAQRKGGRIEVSDNLMAANRVGLTGVAIGAVVLDKNNLTSQMPRLFAGEFSQYLTAYLTEVQRNSENSYSIAAPDGTQADAFLTTCNKG